MLSRAYESWLIPFLGFFLLPWATLAYAVMWDTGGHGVSGFEWLIVILAFLFDLAAYAERGRKRQAAAWRQASLRVVHRIRDPHLILGDDHEP